MTAKRRTPAPNLVCTRCTTAYVRWPGATCKSCGAFSTSIITLDEARARGVPLPFALVGASDKVSRQRWRTGLAGFNRILSHEGGVVPAASVLVAACPGSGKTTLLLAAGGRLSRGRRRVAYCSSEQDVASLHGLAERLGVHQLARLVPVAVASVDDVERIVRDVAPALVVVDSATEIAKRSRTQPQAVVAALHELAHGTSTAVFATAHINAAGLVRGGPELEHATDLVLMLTGDPRRSPRRELAASKNRHGDTTRTAIIEHTAHGFRDVAEVGPAIPRRAMSAPGCVIGLARSAERIVALEIEAMLTPSTSTPRKITASGVAVERVRIIVETLSRDLAIPGDVVIRVHGPAVVDPSQLDAACAAAIWSAVAQRVLPAGVAVAGGLSLSGELRGGDVTPEDAAGLHLRLVARPGAALVQALAGAHLRAV